MVTAKESIFIDICYCEGTLKGTFSVSESSLRGSTDTRVSFTHSSLTSCELLYDGEEFDRQGVCVSGFSIGLLMTWMLK